MCKPYTEMTDSEKDDEFFIRHPLMLDYWSIVRGWEESYKATDEWAGELSPADKIEEAQSILKVVKKLDMQSLVEHYTKEIQRLQEQRGTVTPQAAE